MAIVGEKIIVSNCPFCGSERYKELCLDWQGNRYNRCVNCDFVFQDNFQKYDYSQQYWTNSIDPDGKQRNLTEEKDFKTKNWFGGVADYVNSLAGGRLLDVGCGLGYLLSMINDNWKKVGFDLSSDVFHLIKEQSLDVVLISGDIDSLFHKYGSNAFDLIICYHVLEHLENPGQFFNKLCQLLSDRGKLIIGTPNNASFCARWFKGNYRLLGNGHICMFSPKHLRQLFKINNIRIIKEEYPFFKTSYFTISNILRLVNRKKISPPFYGNIMTFYGEKTI